MEQVRLKFVKLDKEVLSQINKENITAVLWGGRMGDEGARYILFNDSILSYANVWYGENDITDKDLQEVFPYIDDAWKPFPTGINTGEINEQPWIQCYLGFGFFLFMNMESDFYDKLGYDLFVCERRVNVRMENWMRIVEFSKDSGRTCVVEEITGDALNTDADMLLHQVNLQGYMGGGIAAQIAKTFPKVEKEYVEYKNKSLGEVLFVKTDKYVIGNCFSQEKNFDTNYKALENCLDKVVEYLKENNLKSVAIPYKYGCGIANGDWDTVYDIFKEKLKDYTLKIYKLN